MRRAITVEHDGVTYSAQQAVIKSTALTFSDHGILSAWIHVQGEGWGTGVGGYCLDQPKDKTSSDYSRVGTAYGLDHIIRLIETVGVESWEKIPGQQILVLYPEGSNGLGQVACGIAHPIEDKVFILKAHADEWREREGLDR